MSETNPLPTDNPCNNAADGGPDDLDEYLDGLLSGDSGFISRDRIAERLGSIEDRLDQLVDQLRQINESQRERTGELENYLKIVAECQRQTATLANRELERHLLHPAIEAASTLKGLIDDLLEQAAGLPENEAFCPFVKPIVDSIKQAASVAEAETKSLGIETIAPRHLNDLDAHRHDVKQTVAADDNTSHGKIERTLVPGLAYRGKVLRQAKVSVYRYVTNQPADSKGLGQ